MPGKNPADLSGPLRCWGKIIHELNALQNIYTSISLTPGTAALVKPKNYLQELQDVKEQAASDYYDEGNALLSKEGRDKPLHELFCKPVYLQYQFRSAHFLMPGGYTGKE